MPIISIEGVNRAGKTTPLQMLIPALPNTTTIIRSPGGTPAGEKIRKTVKAALAGDINVSPVELARLNIKGFALSEAELIKPALEANSDGLILLGR
jgi:thymidylate kinase